MNYTGTIIEESLSDRKYLSGLKIFQTKVKPATDHEKTPWLKQWTLHSIEIPERRGQVMAKKLSAALDQQHNWYVDFKNDQWHFVIFRNKVFRVDCHKPEEYQAAKQYGRRLGIPDSQLDFTPKPS